MEVSPPTKVKPPALVNKLRGKERSELATFMRMSWGALILMGSTCFWVCVGMPCVARMACSLQGIVVEAEYMITEYVDASKVKSLN